MGVVIVFNIVKKKLAPMVLINYSIVVLCKGVADD